MGPRKRQPGERRWMPVEFPLTDDEGRHVLHDRRREGDRRKAIASLEELRILLSELSSVDPEPKQ